MNPQRRTRLPKASWLAAVWLIIQMPAAGIAGWDENFADALTGYLHAAHDRPQKAVALLLKAARATGQPQLYEHAAEQALIVNDMHLISVISNEWYDSGGGVPALRLYGNVLIRSNGYPSAAGLLARIAEEGGAREVYRTIVSTLPKTRDGRLVQRASAAMAAAHPKQLRDATYWAHQALLFYYGNAQDLAEEAARLALEEDPASPDALAAALLAKFDSPVLIADRFAQALGADLGSALLAFRFWQESFKTSYAALPEDYSLWLQAEPEQSRLRATAFMIEHQQPERALTELGQLDFHSPRIDYALALQIEALRQLEREDAIDQLLEQAVDAVPPAHIGPVAHLAAQRIEKKSGSQAAFEYLAAVKTPQPVDRLLELTAHYAARAEQIETAEQILRELVGRNPDNANFLNSLGYLYADYNFNLEEGEMLLKKALEMEPESPEIIDSYGWILFRLGRLEPALLMLKRSEQIFLARGEPAPGEVIAHIGEVYWALGMRARAIATWQSGLKNFPEDEYLLETIRRYD
ncbi:MAG: hypothetical protein OXC81_00760, partial [Betaproteobacteria bacterium]|nr:hypothetical protein [Betaproteobacteria bacterium]